MGTGLHRPLHHTPGGGARRLLRLQAGGPTIRARALIFAAVFAAGIAASFLPGAEAAAAEPAEGRPCVLCHPSRDPNAYTDVSKMPGVTPGREAAEAFVCWSCHGGAVRDDRARLTVGGSHPVGARPAGEAPSAYGEGRFPLYNGKIACGTCHTAHNKGALGKRWLRASDDLDGVCAGCHPDHDIEHRGAVADEETVRRIRSQGGRVGGDGRMGCRSCHTPHGAPGPKLTLFPAGTDACSTCHTNRMVPGKIAADRGQPCRDCHEVHGKTRPFLKGGEEGPCRLCHDTYGGPADHLAPGGAGCGDCHSIHRPAREEGKSNAFLLFPPTGGALCLRCHPEAQKRHGADIAVPAAAVPRLREKGLKLEADGKLTCTTCHQTHGSPYRGRLGWSASVACLYCHAKENPYGGGGQKPGIHPVGVFLSRERRVALGVEPESLLEEEGGRKGFSIADPGATLTCGSCHDTHGTRRDKPADCVSCHTGRSKTAAHGGKPGCTACHQIHGDKPPAVACTGCHKEEREYVHAGKEGFSSDALPLFDGGGVPTTAGAMGCPTCHDPHGGERSMLRRPSPDAVCSVCHADKEGIRATAHGALGASDGAENRWGPDLCLPCHDVHRDPTPDLTRRELDDPLAERCFSCHKQARKVIDDHTMRGVPPWKKTIGRVPLFNALGQRDDMGFMSCPSCHDVHGASGAGLMRVEADDPPDLCLSCHRERLIMLGSPHDPKAAGKKGRCTGCHPPHSGEDTPAAWKLQVAGTGTWNDRKCMGCHSNGSMEGSPYLGSRSHPVNLTVPRTRSVGGLPLYDSLGEGSGWVVACATCHDIHGKEGGGGARIGDFLRVPVEGGQLCAQCHPDQASVAGTPHEVAEPRGRLPAPCGPCHTIHDARLDAGLWALEPAEGEYAPNRLCRSCHTGASEVRKGMPLMQHHMRDAEERLTPRGTIYLQRPMSLVDQYALRTGEKPAIPLFDREGNERPEGSLQCPSCHEPHRWSPFGPQIKPGVPIHETVPRHFTRFDDLHILRRSVCAACHDNSLEPHFRRYHEVWSDVGEEFHRDTQIEKARRLREEAEEAEETEEEER